MAMCITNAFLFYLSISSVHNVKFKRGRSKTKSICFWIDLVEKVFGRSHCELIALYIMLLTLPN